MRFAIGVVLALSVGIGAYFGSAQVATSAKTSPQRTVTMRLGDVAVFGQVKCLATSDSRSHPMSGAYLRCGERQGSKERYWADVSPNVVVVWSRTTPNPLYHTPR